MEHQQQQQHQPRFGHFATNAGRAFSNFATSSLQNLTTRKYTLPDKSVASQVLMYRQLLHTNCKPGLKLSREYQGTPAQKAVLHMPWWEEGIEESGKMVISYDNLIVRLWLNGAIMPHSESNLLDKASIDTMVDEKGLPPIPHDYWVYRLGFQQPDPVTDFRSGGVLSLAMMVHVVEACPAVHERFVTPRGDACVMPFAITSINVTDMIAKFCMLAKSIDRMDALLSQKPFWRMFADPSSILVLQELSLDMLADVVVQLGEERKIPGYRALDDTNHSMHKNGDEPGKVTVFDFSLILERTEKRVERDLLASGPRSVEELRSIAAKLKLKYQNQLERRKHQAEKQQQLEDEQPEIVQTSSGGEIPAFAAPAESATSKTGTQTVNGASKSINMQGFRNVAGQSMTHATKVASGATNMAAGVLAKVKSPGFSPLRKSEEETGAGATQGTEAHVTPDLLSGSGSAEDGEGDWVQQPSVGNPRTTDAVEHFSIDDDEDML